MLMSGGVDSSVSAALLKEQGYEVIGFYILGWLGTPDFPCPWQKEEKDAREVADKLNIPFYTVNLSKVYEKEVIDQFFAGYQAGLTPNPDILCNREIKFKALWQAIRQFECDYIATGHYARLQRQLSVNSYQLSKSKIEKLETENLLKTENWKLKTASHPAIFKSRDENKDQTYFLWGVDRTMLDKIIFPLGELTKPEVRQLAKRYKLPTATKKDSQGICFVGPLKVRQFLSSRVETAPGEVFLTDGRKIATHQGVELYTIGQRLSAGSVDWTGDVPPLFVIAKDIKNNRLIVGSDAATFGIKLVAGSINWMSEPSDRLFECLAKIRYRQKDEAVHVHKNGSKLSVEFATPVRALTAGQSIVFYSKQGQLLGGAIIELIPNQNETVKRLTKTFRQTKV